jgi:hypothetical protein
VEELALTVGHGLDHFELVGNVGEQRWNRLRRSGVTSLEERPRSR